MPTNVLGSELQACCHSPVTGFYRDGYCRTGPEDRGLHTVCCQVTQPFLEFLLLRGNNLITPRPEYDFPGLTAGDRWCVCVRSWAEAYEAGFASPVVLEASHISVLEFVDLAALKAHAVEQ
jgi:uncharacterized protein (DUF2237 family)